MPKAKITDEQRELILTYIGMGWGKERIAKAVGVSRMQVAAVYAHRTMRTYEKAEDLRSINRASYKARALSPLSPLETTRGQTAALIGEEAESGREVYWDPSPLSGMPNPHLMIIGESGYGKSYSAQCVIAELARRNIPSIVFDYGQGFTLDAVPLEFAEFVSPVEVLASERGISLNPLNIYAADIRGPVNVAVRVSDTFSRIYNIGIQQHSILRDTILIAFKDKGIYEEDKSTWTNPPPSLSDIMLVLEGISKDKGHTNWTTATKLKSHISTFFIFNIFRETGEHISWQSLAERKNSVCVIQLKGLEGKTGKVVTEFLLWDLYNHLISSGPQPLRLFCVLDEAHNLLFEKDSPVEKLVREGRKFGMGLILVSQQPEDFSVTAYSNTGSKLVFQIFDDRGRISKQLARKCMNFPNSEPISKIISKLPRGQAFFLTRNTGYIVTVLDFRARKKRWLNENGR